MKPSVLISLASLVTGAVASPFRHVHRHAILRRNPDPAPAIETVPAPVETIVVFELNGHTISEEEVRQGINNGTLVWGEDGVLSTSIAQTPPIAATPTAEPVVSAQKDNTDGEQVNVPIDSQGEPADQPALKDSEEVQEQEKAPIQPDPQDDSPVDADGYCADCDKEFPNGKYSCDEFPAGYGAVPLSHEGLGGWSGIQDPIYRGSDGMDNIMTVPTGSCEDGSCCTPGRYCSYACPNPYLKLSFPKQQGRDGQSVGGLFCNNHGKLEMADGSIGKTLCGPSSKHFSVRVENKLSKSVSICRTDYPGTESETIPLTVGPGQSGFLANPDQSSYYFWENKATSAHYYINKQGVSEGEACTWGTRQRAVGNWAPLNFGTSFDDQGANSGYSSLHQNRPTTEERLDFTVTFEGKGITNPCSFRHKTGEYCNGEDCDKDKGCTASISDGGSLTLVFTDN